MIRINSADFKGARAYFTGLEKHNLANKRGNEEEKRTEIERDLKMLLLTKSTIVAGGSHLTSSKFAYNILRSNPVLLEQNLILPTWREDMNSPVEYLSRLKGATNSELREMEEFYKSMYTHGVSWRVTDNSGKFKQRFYKELVSEKSVLRRNLEAIPIETVNWMLRKIDKLEDFSKKDIEALASQLPPGEAKVMRVFRDLIYQMTGSQTHNSESVLPQENYVDYSLADMESRKTLLSESQIFWKLFMELFFETISKPKLPVQMLDLLTFEDIVEIREPLLQSSFTEDYEAVIRAAVGEHDGWQSGKTLLSIEELMTIRERLAKKFSNIFDRQIGRYIKKKNLLGGSLIKSDFNVGLQYIPQTVKLELRGSIGSLINAPTDLPTARAVSAYDRETQDKMALSKLLLKRAKIENETVFVDAIKLLTDRLNGSTIS